MQQRWVIRIDIEDIDSPFMFRAPPLTTFYLNRGYAWSSVTASQEITCIGAGDGGIIPSIFDSKDDVERTERLVIAVLAKISAKLLLRDSINRKYATTIIEWI